MNLEDYIKEILQALEMQEAAKINEELKKIMSKNNKNNSLLQNAKLLSNQNVMQGGITYNNPLLKNPNEEIFMTNNYKNTPTIYNQPNTQEIYAAPDRLWQDKIIPQVKKGIAWAKNEPNILMNKEVDYSKPMNPHESATDKTIKILRPAYKASSDMYTDGMTDFSRAKKNPNAQVTNIENLDKDLQEKLKNYGVKSNEKGILYNQDSYMSKLFSNSPEIKKIKEDYYDDIKQGKKNEFPVDFEGRWYHSVKNPNKFDRHNSIQHGMLTDVNIDENDNLTGKLYDRADFLQRNVKHILDIPSMVNNHGYNMQEKGNFQNYFSVTDINQANNVKKDEVNKIKKLLEEFLKMLH